MKYEIDGFYEIHLKAWFYTSRTYLGHKTPSLKYINQSAQRECIRSHYHTCLYVRWLLWRKKHAFMISLIMNNNNQLFVQMTGKHDLSKILIYSSHEINHWHPT